MLVAYAGPVRPAAALRDSVLCLPTDIHSLFVNKPSSSSSSSSSCSTHRAAQGAIAYTPNCARHMTGHKAKRRVVYGAR